jgi:DNA-directed RNA polymerase subunit RPC12/RpoP
VTERYSDVECKCGERLVFVDRWDDAQETNHCYNLYTCDTCGRVLKDSIWVEPHRVWIEVDGTVEVLGKD